MKDSSVDTGLKDGNRHFWRVTETSNGLNLSGFFSIESKGLLKQFSLSLQDTTAGLLAEVM